MFYFLIFKFIDIIYNVYKMYNTLYRIPIFIKFFKYILVLFYLYENINIFENCSKLKFNKYNFIFIHTRLIIHLHVHV